MKRFASPDSIGGLIMLILSALFIWGALYHPIGNPSRMGPGFFPLAIGSIGLLYSILIIVMSFSIDELAPKFPFSSIAVVSISVFLFAITVERLGVIPATLLVSAVMSMTSYRTIGSIKIFALSITLSLIVFIIFYVLLNSPMIMVKGL